MDSAAQLDALIGVLGRLGIDVRYEHLGGAGGGLCELRGQRIVFIDLDADVATRLDRCLRAAPGLHELETIYVPPVVREMIDRFRS
jgi:hypothetical protein